MRELRRNQPERPFLVWLGMGAGHAPHHVTPEWSDAYAGRFDAGWDEWRRATLERQIALGIVAPGTELPTPSDHVPDWDDMDPDQRRVAARMMEVYAGFLTHADAQLGRILAALDELGERDNTVVIVVSDNGASGEAGPHGSVSEFRFAQGRDEDPELNLALIDELGGHRTYNHYPWGWAEAGNTPVRRFKRYTFEGGVRDPFIVSWPAGLDAAGEIRHQYSHAVDVLPTLLDLLDIDPPEQLQRRRADELRRRDAAPDAHLGRRPRPAHRAVLRVLGQPGHVRRRLEGRHEPRQPAHPRRARPDRRQRGLRPATTGTCSTPAPTPPRTTTSATSTPSGATSWSPAGTPRPSATACCR